MWYLCTVQLLILVGFHLVSRHLQFASKQFPVSKTYDDHAVWTKTKLQLVPPLSGQQLATLAKASTCQTERRKTKRKGRIVDKSLVYSTFPVPLLWHYVFFILPR